MNFNLDKFTNSTIFTPCFSQLPKSNFIRLVPIIAYPQNIVINPTIISSPNKNYIEEVPLITEDELKKEVTILHNLRSQFI